MTSGEPPSAGSEPDRATEPEAGGRRLGHRLALTFVVATVVPLVAYAAFVATRFWTPPEWEFSVAARSDVVSIVLAEEGETRWRVDGAVVCTRPAPQGASGLLSVDTPAICGSTRWTASRIDSPEAVLRLEGGVRAHLERGAAGELALSLRPADGATGAGVVESSDGRARLPLPRRAHLVWPASGVSDGEGAGFPASGVSNPEGAEGPATGELVFPFTGRTTIGRDVGWSDARLLHEGTIAVYTADDSADERRKVDEAELMLGDQVRIGFVEGRDGDGDDTVDGALRIADPAKGFVRWSPGSDAPLDVVAFGRAAGLVIDRFGESGYGFTPGILIRILNDPIVIVLGVLLMSWINLFSIFQPLVGVPGVLEGGRDVPRGRRRIVHGLLRRIIGRFGRRTG